MVDLRILRKDTLPQWSPEQAEEGLVLLVDKPLGWTSFDVVNKVRYLLRRRLQLKKLKVGHAGTLDPMATGLLILCTGKYTSLLDSFQAQTKQYSGIIRLGARTASYDAETPEEDARPWAHLTPEQIREASTHFTGEIEQIPPAYSAIKIDGQRSYDLARKGKEKQLAARAVTVSAFDIDATRLPDVSFEVTCSKGTYIRSLAHDLGATLGCGAYLRALRRDGIGAFLLTTSVSLDDLAAWCAPEGPQREDAPSQTE